MSARAPGGGEDLAALVAIVEDLAGAVGARAHDRRLRKVERTAVRRSPAAARRRRPHRVGQVVAGGRRPVAPVDPEATAAELADWVDWLRTTDLPAGRGRAADLADRPGGGGRAGRAAPGLAGGLRPGRRTRPSSCSGRTRWLGC